MSKQGSAEGRKDFMSNILGEDGLRIEMLLKLSKKGKKRAA